MGAVETSEGTAAVGGVHRRTGLAVGGYEPDAEARAKLISFSKFASSFSRIPFP